MEISFVAELFHPHIGGAEFRTLQFARGLAARGHRVSVYTIDHTGGSLPAEETFDGIRIVRWAQLPDYLGVHGRSLTAMAQYGRHAAQMMTDGLSDQSDAVIVNQWPLVHLLQVRRGRAPPGLVVDWCEWWDTPLRRPIFREAAIRCPKGIAVEEHVASRIRRANPRAQIEVVRTPVPLDPYRTGAGSKDPNLVLFVGRVAAQKRVDLLAEAVIWLNEVEGISKRLVVLGDGPLRPSLEERFARHSYIEFLGRVPESTKVEYLRRAWVLGICSRREGMPVTLMEAVATNTPVVMVRSPLNPSGEFVQSHGIGLLATRPRARELARAIAALDDLAIRLSVREAEERLLPLFSPDAAIDTLERFAARACGVKPGVAG